MNSLSYLPTHQNYCMHLKSTNGPIDVLVCPDIDDTCPGSPCLSETSQDSATPQRLSQPRPHMPGDDLDVSLSSAADLAGDDFEGLIQNCADLDQHFDGNELAAAICSFESLSPPLQGEDFCFGLSDSEGIADLFDF